jgi:hypothetical protein
MTETESLITKARRYCTENFSYWSKRYQEEMSGNNNPYSDNDYDLFPRYNALNTILQGVETIVGKEFNSFEECKEELKIIGLETHSINTINSNKELHLLGKMSKFFGKSGKLNKIERNAIHNERKKFVEFIDNQNLESVLNIQPLPYERKLSVEESEMIRNKLLENWNFDGDYWEPLNKKSPKPTIFLMDDNFIDTDKNEIEKTIKAHLMSDKLFVITEDRIDYEIETTLLDIDLYETIICDSTFEWVVYGSHESTIAFGGDFLIDKLNQLFDSRKEKLNKWEQNW